MPISRLNSCDGLHPDNINWCRYLAACDLISSNGEWSHYARSNCHYIIHSPTKLVIHGVYDYHGYNVYNDLICDAEGTIVHYIQHCIYIHMLLNYSEQESADRLALHTELLMYIRAHNPKINRLCWESEFSSVLGNYWPINRLA